MFIEESFFIWVGRQSLVGLEWQHPQIILLGDLKPANILAFYGRHTPRIKIGDLGFQGDPVTNGYGRRPPHQALHHYTQRCST